MNMKAIQHIKNIQIRPAVPPSTSPIEETLSAVSQETMRIIEKPNIDKNRKFLCDMSLVNTTKGTNALRSNQP